MGNVVDGTKLVDEGGDGREVQEDDELAIGPAEHLTRDLARVRAKFGMDPALASPSLDAAWKTETAMEEDEAEFVDTVADCLGAGLSLEDALTCWDSGGLAYDAREELAAAAEADEFDWDWPQTDRASWDDNTDKNRTADARTAKPPPGLHRVFVR